jgi:hypothetical protein
MTQGIKLDNNAFKNFQVSRNGTRDKIRNKMKKIFYKKYSTLLVNFNTIPSKLIELNY